MKQDTKDFIKSMVTEKVVLAVLEAIEHIVIAKTNSK